MTTNNLERNAGPVLYSDHMTAPTEKKERISTLDFLRGFALLGILALNIESFAGPESLHDIPTGLLRPAFVGWHASLDMVILTFKWLFFEGKMRALFAMLFGAGVVLFCERLQRRGPAAPVADLYLRRCMWLLLFGLLHGTLIWGGDILTEYALCGLLFLFPFRNLSAKKLILTGSIIWFGCSAFAFFSHFDGFDTWKKGAEMEAIHHIVVQGGVLNEQQKTLLDTEKKADEKAAKRADKEVRQVHGGYLESLPENTSGFFGGITVVLFSGLVGEVLGAMLLGMGLYKAGFLTGAWRARHYVLVAGAGYAVSLPVVLYGLWRFQGDAYSHIAAIKWLYLPYSLEQPFGALANVAVLILLSRLALLQPLVNGLANIGRMAFSNYILTSLLCQTVFVWSSLKLYGQLEYYQYIYVVLLIWLINFAFSAGWLRKFNYGPLEWVWRSLTYWKRQSLFRKKARVDYIELAWLP